MSGVSLYQRLSETGHLLEVGVDEMQLLLPGDQRVGIGTKGLNGCTCVVILGDGILLAHIAPLPGRYEQWTTTQKDVHQASHEHHKRMLFNVSDQVRNNAPAFPTSTTAWGVFSYGANGSLQAIIRQVQTHLATIGYEMRPAFYQELNPTNVMPPKGELVGIRRAGVAELYLESRKLWPAAQASSSSTEQRPVLTAANRAVPSSSSVEGFWAYSPAVDRFAYRCKDGRAMPEQQWPAKRGRVAVFDIETKQRRMYDFSTSTWVAEGKSNEEEDEDGDDDDDEGDEDEVSEEEA